MLSTQWNRASRRLGCAFHPSATSATYLIHYRILPPIGRTGRVLRGRRYHCLRHNRTSRVGGCCHIRRRAVALLGALIAEVISKPTGVTQTASHPNRHRGRRVAWSASARRSDRDGGSGCGHVVSQRLLRVCGPCSCGPPLSEEPRARPPDGRRERVL